MKFLFAIAGMLIASVGFGAAPVVPEFADIDELRKWAARESFGGAEVDVLKHRGLEVAVVRRSFTSGVQSCALSIFAKDGGRWRESLSLAPVWGAWLGLRQKEDVVYVVIGKEAREVLRFSISELQPHKRIE